MWQQTGLPPKVLNLFSWRKGKRTTSAKMSELIVQQPFWRNSDSFSVWLLGGWRYIDWKFFYLPLFHVLCMYVYAGCMLGSNHENPNYIHVYWINFPKPYLVLSFPNTVSMIAYWAYWQNWHGWGPQRTKKSAVSVYVLNQYIRNRKFNCL